MVLRDGLYWVTLNILPWKAYIVKHRGPIITRYTRGPYTSENDQESDVITVMAVLGCQLDNIFNELKPKWQGTPVRDFLNYYLKWGDLL